MVQQCQLHRQRDDVRRRRNDKSHFEIQGFTSLTVNDSAEEVER
jgi:hypothetical protein